MSQLEVDKIIPSSGTTLTIGDSGDTINISDGTALTVDSTTFVIDQSANRVGINTATPSFALSVSSTSSNTITAINTASNVSRFCFAENSTPSNTYTNIEGDARSSGYLAFRTNDSERMRIDSSGNVLVGTTDNSLYNNSGVGNGGVMLANTTDGGRIDVARNGVNLIVNRLSTDGLAIEVKKDGTTVGRIGSITGNAMYVNAPNDGGGGFLFADNASTIYPTRRTSGTVSLSDNTNDLGAQVWRFNDAYITNGVTTGSDQNEKQQIQLLTDSEIAVAKRIAKGFKTFKWNSAVEEKGDNARIHTGVIAQEIQQAFTDEGLDAGNYALFMSNTYWEKEISVDAVAEELDEEGNVIVEGQDAYTYTDIKYEATEGYTEKTRLGIRYPELLSFVSSAFEQRLTNIETRLEALENV